MDVPVEEHGGYTKVAARGRLNLVGATALRSAVTAALRSGPPRLIVNMAGIDFMDSTGLGTLVGCLTAAREQGTDLRIANVGARVRAVLELTSMDGILVPYEASNTQPQRADVRADAGLRAMTRDTQRGS